ncbi:TetR/AcrR family transcriptional regulator [Pseudomonas sp. UBA1879]|uniref:TetR/AcrR family transcriptional regulator n=1 Tax=Pseudomonas sp. UBA1879 TaxID=1947305 RepID=UPI0025ED1A6F|nr:TetR/AcrR family transcriptional regulator [Pseudomonas sp. UBA1879]
MNTTIRRRRPAFDREEGVRIAQELFHAHGYDAVSIADLTKAMSIVPPSLYAAYGSKLELFERALNRYVSISALPIDKLLALEGEPTEVLTNLFVTVAKHYTQHPSLRGCMVTEAMRADDPEAAAMAVEIASPAISQIRSYVAKHAPPEKVDGITDYVVMTLRGLSSYACLGYAQEKLVECSKVAGRVFEAEFAPG